MAKLTSFLLLIVGCMSQKGPTNDTGISKACVHTKDMIFAKAYAYEASLENETAKLFEEACHESVHKYHACVATLNWNKYANKLHQYDDIVTSVDKGASVCFINYHFNMKIGDSDSYHYDLRRSGLFPVGSKCTADDRAQILKNYKHIYLADTLKDLPSAHVTDETVEYDDRSCMTPAKCQGKADYTCDSSGNFAGFCLDGLDRKCAPGTFCSKAFHKKFPTKDPCITTSTSYGCNKATKQCEIHAGYQNQTECVEDTSCTH